MAVGFTTISLLISVALVLVLIRKLSIGISIFIGSMVLSLLVFGERGFEVLLEAIISPFTIRIVVIVILAFTLGYTMEYYGMLQKLADEFAESMNVYSFVFIPLVVGLLPMPGGALISAVALAPFLKKFDLSPERATVLNYWFRHVWVTVWPLYPTVIIGAAVLNLSFSEFIHATAVLMPMAFLSGMVLRPERRVRVVNFRRVAKSLAHLYPIFIVAILTIVLKLDLLITLSLTLIILFLRLSSREKIAEDLKNIMSRTVDVRIIVLVFAVMCYRDVIEVSGATHSLFSDLQSLNIPDSVVASLLTFFIGFATGIEMSYSSIALPLLSGYIMPNGLSYENLMLVVGSGFAGVILSPLHLCYVLTAEYFKADMRRCYKLLIPPFIIYVTMVSIFYVLWRML